ncbi:hypothetical protein B0H19DRAFT_1103824 [Mycena capillaripes]|nr:hypothetical protein B0H19DRAFT_1103824 [Mycena capillaripes]
MPLVVSELPVELADLVIKNIDVQDTRTLCVCGLVSRAWLALSRPILFRCISLRLDASYRRSNAHSFATLLRRPDRATFLLLVKEIELTGRHPWTHTVLPRLMRYFPAFTTLRLHDVSHEDASALSTAFAHLVHLVLVFRHPHSYFPPTRDVLRLLEVFPVLQHVLIASEVKPEMGLTPPPPGEYLDVDPGIKTSLLFAFPVSEHPYVSKTAAPVSSQTEKQSFQCLRTIELDYRFGSDVETIKYIMPHTPPLTTLSLVYRSTAYPCIRDVGPALRSHTLIFPHPHMVGLFQRSASLDPLTPRLQTLRFCATHSALFRLAASLLSTTNFRPGGPEELELELGDPKLATVTNADFAAVDSDDDTAHSMALAELDRVVHALPGLLKVQIHVHDAWDISISLPLCKAAGKLL